MGYSTNQIFSADHLRKLPTQERLGRCPLFLRNLVESAQTRFDLKRVIVFGSRSRQDFRPMSDYDICFEIKDFDQNAWAEFLSISAETVETLLNLDLVNLDQCSSVFKAKILDEGVVIFEKYVT